jgi:hypothetical protein
VDPRIEYPDRAEAWAAVVCSVTAGAGDVPLARLSPTHDHTGSSTSCTPPGSGTAAGPSNATVSDKVAS